MTTLSIAEYEVLLRNDLSAFMQRCFIQLNPGQAYGHNWHIDLIAAKIQQALSGKVRRLIVCVPPRHLKSLLASIAAPAFLLGHQPSSRILCVSYAQDLANSLAMQSRAIMQSAWYQRLFGTRLSTTRSAVPEFLTTQNGYRLSVSVGGALTGRGADLIIIDDPMKPEEALSDTQRKNVNDWYDNTLYSRQNHKGQSGIILIMQRLHEDDLVGHLLQQEPWEVVSLPANAQADETYAVETPLGPRVFHRSEGDILHPARESEETLLRIRETLGEYHFACQYQQTPAPFGGGMIKPEWFNRFDLVDPPAFDRIIQSWDTANKPTELSDYSVCTTWGQKKNDIFLLHVLRRRMDYPDLKRAVKEQADRYNPQTILIEDKASGTQLIQELIQDGEYAVTKYEPQGDKIMRAHAQTAMIENGFVFVPNQASWLAEYLHELETFPKGRYDDQVDSTSQALEWIKAAGAEPGIITYYRMECERLGLIPPRGHSR
jgi:predicted phage terminase large subunit-like protein